MKNKTQIIKRKDILSETDYYKWLVAKFNKGEICDSFIKTVKEYTNHIPAPFKGRNDAMSHKYVFNAFWSDIVKPTLYSTNSVL